MQCNAGHRNLDTITPLLGVIAVVNTLLLDTKDSCLMACSRIISLICATFIIDKGGS